MAILGVNSFDNHLYFLIQHEEEETEMNVVEEEVIATLPEVIAALPHEIIQVSDAIAKEHLDCNVERLVRSAVGLRFHFCN